MMHAQVEADQAALSAASAANDDLASELRAAHEEHSRAAAEVADMHRQLQGVKGKLSLAGPSAIHCQSASACDVHA